VDSRSSRQVVAVITPHLPPVVGGISTFSRETIRELSTRNVECWGFGRQGGSSANREIVGGSSRRFVWQVFLAMIRIRPGAIHAHSHWYTLLPGAMYRALRPSTRLVFTFHTQPAGPRPLVLMLFRLLLTMCTAITYVSKELQSRLPTFGRTFQLVTYPAPEPEILRARQRQPVQNTLEMLGRTSVVFVGPLVWPLKVEGVRLLVESFQRIAPRHDGTVLVIVGDGPLRANLEAFARGLLADRVIFTGNLEDVAPTIIACRVYAHISLQEGLPISLLNAMAMGKPVLTTRVGGIPEVVRDGETGVLVDPEIEKIARALDQLLSNPILCSKLGEAAARYVTTTFTWKKTVDQFLVCYEDRS